MPQVAGAVIGDRYRLIAKIGEGGMASVWEAEHVALGNRLAVKFLHRTAPQGSEVAQRFLREARVAASVKHRNVVDINDFGFTEEDVPYMVMERLVGEPLADYMFNQGPLPIDQACRLVSLTLRGLAAVHDAGIVHRDLKPDNIFLVHDEDGFFPKLLDFGLSRRAGRTDMTMEGTLMGTPEYMSPEQARGQNDLDARTDIYSVGVILYEMITGRLPFESELMGDLIAMIARDTPTPVTAHRADVPPELVQVIERAMAKNREERFQDAREMRFALVDAAGGGFVEPGSGLTSLSEMPPAPAEPRPVSIPRAGPTPSGGLRTAASGKQLKTGRISAEVAPRGTPPPVRAAAAPGSTGKHRAVPPPPSPAPMEELELDDDDLQVSAVTARPSRAKPPSRTGERATLGEDAAAEILGAPGAQSGGSGPRAHSEGSAPGPRVSVTSEAGLSAPERAALGQATTMHDVAVQDILPPTDTVARAAPRPVPQAPPRATAALGGALAAASIAMMLGVWVSRDGTALGAGPLAAVDGGLADGGLGDGGLQDAGPYDAGPHDGGPDDAGSVDAGELDGGELDAGELDGGAEGAGAELDVDAGSSDEVEEEQRPTKRRGARRRPPRRRPRGR